MLHFRRTCRCQTYEVCSVCRSSVRNWSLRYKKITEQLQLKRCTSPFLTTHSRKMASSFRAMWPGIPQIVTLYTRTQLSLLIPPVNAVQPRTLVRTLEYQHRGRHSTCITPSRRSSKHGGRLRATASFSETVTKLQRERKTELLLDQISKARTFVFCHKNARLWK